MWDDEWEVQRKAVFGVWVLETSVNIRHISSIRLLQYCDWQ